LAVLCRRRKNSASIIGATCAFDAKIYKNVDGIFAVSAFLKRNKKNFLISDFCFQLPSLLVEIRAPKEAAWTRLDMIKAAEKRACPAGVLWVGYELKSN
jgi:hypothetical protein